MDINTRVEYYYWVIVPSHAPQSAAKKPRLAEPKKNGEGHPYWNIDDKKRITVRTFKGKTYVDIREFYEKDGETLPGKKGKCDGGWCAVRTVSYILSSFILYKARMQLTLQALYKLVYTIHR